MHRGAVRHGAVPPGAARPGAAPPGAARPGAARPGAARRGRPARRPAARYRTRRGRVSAGWSEATGMSTHAAVESQVVASSIKSSLPAQAIVYLVVVMGTAVALSARFVFDVHTGDLSMEQWAT